MLWLVLLVCLAAAIGGSAYFLDWRDRRRGHRPGSGQPPDTTALDEQPPRSWGDYGGSGGM